MGKIISINNFKGGVSKTSTLCGLAYVLSEKKGYKVLVVDFDPQADATELLIRTFDNERLPNALHDEKYVNIFDGLKEGNVNNAILKLSDNLSIVPSDFDLIGLSDYLNNKYRYKDAHDRVKELSQFLEPIKEEYDFIFIDTPPTISDFSNNAIFACDYSLIIMQTHRRSYRAVDKFLLHMVDFRDIYKTEFDVLGIIPVMFSRNTKTDEMTLQDASADWGSYVFEQIIRSMERVKFWDEFGISEEDYWDKQAIEQYEVLADEFLERYEKAIEEEI